MSFNLIPDGDLTSDWFRYPVSGGWYDKVDEDPSSPDIGDYICVNSDNYGNQSFTMSTTSLNGNTISKIEIWVYDCKVNNPGTGTIDIKIDGILQGSQTLEATTTWNTFAWNSYTWDGLSVGQDELDSLEVHLYWDNPGTANIYEITTLYAKCYYSTRPSGIAKVYGIDSSAIAKKYGVNWSDIAKIYGIE